MSARGRWPTPPGGPRRRRMTARSGAARRRWSRWRCSVDRRVGRARGRPLPPRAAPPAAAPDRSSSGLRADSSARSTARRSPARPPFVAAATWSRRAAGARIVEAMKLMNQIEADVRARIAEVLVENGQPVEFGQPLFRWSRPLTAWRRCTCSTRSSSPTGARSRCGSSAPAARWESAPSRSTPPPTRDALPVRFADESVCIGPPAPRASYLNIPAIISAARRSPAPTPSTPATGSSPRTPTSPRSAEHAASRFIGPAAEAIRLMGDKAAARAMAEQAGLPCCPAATGRSTGPTRPQASPTRSAIRSSSRPRRAAAAAACSSSASRERAGARLRHRQAEAGAAFGNGELYLERYVESARHVEVQMLGDEHGNVSPRRARLLGAAPAPEARSRSRPRRRSRRSCASGWRAAAVAAARRAATPRRDLRVPGRRATASSTSWR